MSDGERTESEQERLNRELIELLNELRVALPGVQVLFAFLLTIPFTQRFAALDDVDRGVYFGAVMTAALSIVFLMAPSAHHRMRFREHVKEELIHAANRFAAVGLLFLALSTAAVLYLIADQLYEGWIAALLACVTGVAVVLFWFVFPRRYRPNEGH